MDCVETIARVLCRLEEKDPDEPFFTDRTETVREHGHLVFRHLKVPLWTTYQAEARKFIAVREALRAIDAEGDPALGSETHAYAGATALA